MPIGFDEGEQLIVTQDLAFGYSSQPPLYNWLQFGFFQLFGMNPFAMIALKQSILLGIFAVTYLAWRKSGLNVARAAACTFSMVLITEVGWELQRTRTHLAAAVLMSSLFVLCTFHIFQSEKHCSRFQKIGLYSLLGLIVGLGVLAKYNFLVLPVAIAIAAMFFKPFRDRVLSPWVLLSILTALLVVLPHVFWVLANKDLWASGTGTSFGLRNGAAFLVSRFEGFQSFGKKLFMFYLQAACLIAIILLDWRDWHFSSKIVYSELSESTKRFVNLVGFASLIAIALSLMAVLLSGMTLFKSRWLVTAAFLSIGPFLIRSRILAGPNVRRMFWLIVFAVFTIATVAIIKDAVNGYSDEGNFANLPILSEDVWNELSPTASGTVVVVDDQRVAALLRMRNPEISIVSSGYRLPALVPDSSYFVIAETQDRNFHPRILSLLASHFPNYSLQRKTVMEATGDQPHTNSFWVIASLHQPQ